MFDSIKAWLNIEAKIKPFKKRLNDGTKEFDNEIEVYCYLASEAVVVKDADGREVTSNTQMYIKGSQELDPRDEVFVEGKYHSIKSIGKYYRNKVVDIKVVYL